MGLGSLTEVATETAKRGMKKEKAMMGREGHAGLREFWKDEWSNKHDVRQFIIHHQQKIMD